MNPRHLFALTFAQQQRYQVQPDEFPGFSANSVQEEYELPPYILSTKLRFWYNTQNGGFTTHWHDAQEIIIPLEEEYSVTVQNTEYRLLPGDILLIPPGELHSIEAPASGSRFIFMLGLDLFSQLKDFTHTRLLLSGPVHITADTCPEIYEAEISLIMQAAVHYWGTSPAKQLHIYSCLMDFYARYTDYAASGRARTAKGGSAPRAKSTRLKLEGLLDYIKEHYTENIPLEKAADLTGLSKFYFTRAFREYTGQTWYDYLSFLRIQAAADLLGTTDLPIAKIAADCGYGSLSAFNRTFRKQRGCSPSEYRSLHGHGV